ncbi:MAG: hypothetical protein ACRCWQ_02795 [Bacilli bacterium]
MKLEGFTLVVVVVFVIIAFSIPVMMVLGAKEKSARNECIRQAETSFELQKCEAKYPIQYEY